jgi:hypothetical protein
MADFLLFAFMDNLSAFDNCTDDGMLEAETVNEVFPTWSVDNNEIGNATNLNLIIK